LITGIKAKNETEALAAAGALTPRVDEEDEAVAGAEEVEPFFTPTVAYFMRFSKSGLLEQKIRLYKNANVCVDNEEIGRCRSAPSMDR